MQLTRKIIIMLALSLICSSLVQAQESIPVKVLTWNIWGKLNQDAQYTINNKTARQRMIEILQNSKADIITMVETYGSAKDIAKALNYYYYTPSSKANLAIFSRYKLINMGTLKKLSSFSFIAATAQISPTQKIRLYTIWLTSGGRHIVEIKNKKITDKQFANGDKNRYQHIQQLLNHPDFKKDLANKDNIPVIIAGDFNCVSHLDYTPTTKAKKLNYSRILPIQVSQAMQQAGFIDTYRYIYPNIDQEILGYTWTTVGMGFAYKEGKGFIPVEKNLEPEKRNPYARIDYIYYAGNKLTPINSAVIKHHPSNLQRSFPEFPSDHAALLTAFQLSTQSHQLPLVPYPKEITQTHKIAIFDTTTTISFNSPQCQETAQFCAFLLRDATGWKLPIAKENQGTIQFNFIENKFAPEAYQLEITPKTTTITASSKAGLFYGFQTLRQLLPPQAFSLTPTHPKAWQCPTLIINDAPAYPWRGIMSDVARHFHSPQTIIKILDGMAAQKLNIFHWHLSDDQGWRIEIKKYPRLAQMSKKFYTQEQIKKIVAHAQKLNITIIPEIDMPGHSRASTRAYPQLLCKDKNGNKKQRGRTICPGNEFTYKFIDDVISELAQLFPSPYIHIGADEVGKGDWNKCPDCTATRKKHNLSLHHLQTYFVARVAKIAKKYGKTSLAWDEALNNKTNKDLFITSWRGMQPGINAAKMGRKTIMCPVSRLYFDRINSRSKYQRFGYSNNTINLHQPYFFTPAPPYLTPKQKKCILGAQANVWGEKIRSDQQMFTLIFPRSASLAEALWSQEKDHNWNNYLQRLTTHLQRLKQLQIPYFWEPMSTPIQIATFNQNYSTIQKNITPYINQNGLYEFTIEYIQGDNTFICQEVTLLCNGKSVTTDKHSSTATLAPRRPNQFYRINLHNYDPKAKYTLKISLKPLPQNDKNIRAAIILIPPLLKGQYSPWGKPKK